MVIGEDPPVLHQLDVAFVKGCASLRSVIHDGESKRIILDRDGRVDRIEVGRDVVVGTVVVHLDVPSWPVVAYSFLHFEAVGVCVESAERHVEVVGVVLACINWSVELKDNFMGAVSRIWKTKQVDIESPNFEVRISGYLDDGFICLFTFIVDL